MHRLQPPIPDNTCWASIGPIPMPSIGPKPMPNTGLIPSIGPKPMPNSRSDTDAQYRSENDAQYRSENDAQYRSDTDAQYWSENDAQYRMKVVISINTFNPLFIVNMIIIKHLIKYINPLT